MTTLAEFIQTVVVAGLTFTAAGAIAVAISRRPIQRQRVGELTFVAFLVWAVLAAVPFDRRGPAAAAVPAPVTVVPDVELAPMSSVPLELAASFPDDPSASFVAIPEPSDDGDATFAWLMLLGAVGVALYLVFARVALWWIVRRARPAPAQAGALAAAMSARVPPLYVSETVKRPFCCGLFRPCIVLPVDVCDRGAERTLASVLRHELAHIRQRDLLGQWLTAACWPLLYWNPLYYWLRRETQIAAELIADDIASERGSKTAYVRDLIELIEREPASPIVRAGVVGVFERKTEFYRRMRMLLERKNRLDVRCSRRHVALRFGVAAALVVFGVTSWGMQAKADVEPPKPAAPQAVEKPAALAPRVRLAVEFQYTGAAQLGAVMAAFADGGFRVADFALGPVKGDARVGRVQLRYSGRDVLQRLQSVMPKGPQLIKVMRYPAKTKAAVVVPTPQKRPGAASARVNFSFKDADIRSVLSTIAKIAGANIIISPEVQGSITLQLQGVPWRAAIDAAVRALGYRVVDEGHGIIHVTTDAIAARSKR